MPAFLYTYMPAEKSLSYCRTAVLQRRCYFSYSSWKIDQTSPLQRSVSRLLWSAVLAK